MIETNESKGLGIEELQACATAAASEIVGFVFPISDDDIGSPERTVVFSHIDRIIFEMHLATLERIRGED